MDEKEKNNKNIFMPKKTKFSLGMKKAQIFSSEVFLAYFVFSLTIVIVLFLWAVALTEIKNSERFYAMEKVTLDLGEKLVKTSGIPNDWNKYDVVSIGLCEINKSRILDENKILEFIELMNSSYSKKSNLLGIGRYDFYFNLTDINGTTIEIKNLSAYTGRRPNNPIEMLTIKRTALLNDEIVRLIITVWYGKVKPPEITTTTTTSTSTTTSTTSSTITTTTLPLNWWNANWQYRKQINITNNANVALPVGYSVKIETGTAGEKFLNNGDDVRIIYWNGASNIELDRINETAFNYSNTEIWFKTQAEILAFGSDTGYYMYYGNPSAGSPPNDRKQIYLWWDDFSTDSSSDYDIGRHADDWHGSGIAYPFYNASAKAVYYDAIDNYAGGWKINSISEENVKVEVKMGVWKSYEINTTNGILVRWINNTKFYGIKIAAGSYGCIPGLVKNGRMFDSGISCPGTNTYHSLDGSEFSLSISIYNDTIRGVYNEGEADEVTLSATDNEITGPGQIDVITAQAAGLFDNLKVRKYIEPEPTSYLLTEEKI